MKNFIRILFIVTVMIFLSGRGETQAKDKAYFMENPDEIKLIMNEADRKIVELTESVSNGNITPEKFKKKITAITNNQKFKAAKQAQKELLRAEIKKANKGYRPQKEFLEEHGVDLDAPAEETIMKLLE